MGEHSARWAAAAGSRRRRRGCRGSERQVTEKKKASLKERPLRERTIGSL